MGNGKSPAPRCSLPFSVPLLAVLRVSAVVGHALLSFAYNTAIIAVALNLAMGLFE